MLLPNVMEEISQGKFDAIIRKKKLLDRQKEGKKSMR
jgi:translation elongation factor EF-4